MSDANATMPRVLPADTDGVAEAARLLLAGCPVALPTETVYGLAARADDADAVAAIYAAKGRPDFNPLIVHVPDLATAMRLADFDDRAIRLADSFWPGALTLVLPRRVDAAVAPAVTAGLATVAIRMPAHPVMRAVLAKTGVPLAAPSANRSGVVSPTCVDHVARSLANRIELVLDGGETQQGLESTIVALRADGWQILRPGPITAADLAAVLGPPLTGPASGIEAPGQLASHYAPGKPVRLEAGDARAGEFRIGFGKDEGDFNLSPSGDLTEAASRLYAALHAAAAAPQPRVAVVPVPREGIGEAIADRLRRAAA
ncbi:MAG TPA: L-threonylcarbamoyladenylate synthase [Croceicoccus sp.]|nr:L-threonylcarbamoyladenylate synthase [Croceicoccus sp.]